MLVLLLAILGALVVVGLASALLVVGSHRRRVGEPEAPAARVGRPGTAESRGTPRGDSPAATLVAPPQARPAPAPAAPRAEPIAPAAAGGPEGVGAPVALGERLGKARGLLGGLLAAIRRRPVVDEQAFEELEEALLAADVGVRTTGELLERLRARVRAAAGPVGPEELFAFLKEEVRALFDGDDTGLRLEEGATNVWLVVGVNGVGKTTTIGKLAARTAAEGRRVVLAAGDTFRAAAGEQLETWGTRAGAPVIRGAEGADPSSVIFDAVQHAAARGADLVLADTAGRLHTKVNLMEELRKVRRVADRPPGRVAEVLLVLDATTGQNGLVQARQFAEAAGVTGVVLTKLDGTAKGGVVLALRRELGLPIKLIGVGEGLEDLREFDPAEFADALFS